MNKPIIKRVVLTLACLVFALMPMTSVMAQSKPRISLSASFDDNEYVLILAVEKAKAEFEAAKENEARVRAENGNPKDAEEIREELENLKEAKKYAISYFLENRSNQYESGLTIDKLMSFLDTEPQLKALNLTASDKARVRALAEDSISYININHTNKNENKISYTLLCFDVSYHTWGGIDICFTIREV